MKLQVLQKNTPQIDVVFAEKIADELKKVSRDLVDGSFYWPNKKGHLMSVGNLVDFYEFNQNEESAQIIRGVLDSFEFELNNLIEKIDSQLKNTTFDMNALLILHEGFENTLLSARSFVDPLERALDPSLNLFGDFSRTFAETVARSADQNSVISFFLNNTRRNHQNFIDRKVKNAHVDVDFFANEQASSLKKFFKIIKNTPLNQAIIDKIEEKLLSAYQKNLSVINSYETIKLGGTSKRYLDCVIEFISCETFILEYLFNASFSVKMCNYLKKYYVIAPIDKILATLNDYITFDDIIFSDNIIYLRFIYSCVNLDRSNQLLLKQLGEHFVKAYANVYNKYFKRSLEMHFDRIFENTKSYINNNSNMNHSLPKAVAEHVPTLFYTFEHIKIIHFLCEFADKINKTVEICFRSDKVIYSQVKDFLKSIVNYSPMEVGVRIAKYFHFYLHKERVNANVNVADHIFGDYLKIDPELISSSSIKKIVEAVVLVQPLFKYLTNYEGFSDHYGELMARRVLFENTVSFSLEKMVMKLLKEFLGKNSSFFMYSILKYVYFKRGRFLENLDEFDVRNTAQYNQIRRISEERTTKKERFSKKKNSHLPTYTNNSVPVNNRQNIFRVQTGELNTRQNLNSTNNTFGIFYMRPDNFKNSVYVHTGSEALKKIITDYDKFRKDNFYSVKILPVSDENMLDMGNFYKVDVFKSKNKDRFVEIWLKALPIIFWPKSKQSSILCALPEEIQDFAEKLDKNVQIKDKKRVVNYPTLLNSLEVEILFEKNNTKLTLQLSLLQYNIFSFFYRNKKKILNCKQMMRVFDCKALKHVENCCYFLCQERLPLLKHFYLKEVADSILKKKLTQLVIASAEQTGTLSDLSAGSFENRPENYVELDNVLFFYKNISFSEDVQKTEPLTQNQMKVQLAEMLDMDYLSEKKVITKITAETQDPRHEVDCALVRIMKRVNKTTKAHLKVLLAQETDKIIDDEIFDQRLKELTDKEYVSLEEDSYVYVP